MADRSEAKQFYDHMLHLESTQTREVKGCCALCSTYKNAAAMFPVMIQNGPDIIKAVLCCQECSLAIFQGYRQSGRRFPFPEEDPHEYRQGRPGEGNHSDPDQPLQNDQSAG